MTDLRGTVAPERRGRRRRAQVVLPAILAGAAACLGSTFVGPTSLRPAVRGGAAVQYQPKTEAELEEYFDPLESSRADVEEDYGLKSGWIFERDDRKEGTFRDVVVDDMLDLTELLKLPNPLRPNHKMMLVKLTTDGGGVVKRPTLAQVKALKVSKLRPVTFTWRDESRVQTKGPKQYDEIIQRLLNAGPADMEELVRANWKQFDQMYFFRIMELRKDTPDPRLREKLTNLEKISMEIIKLAQAEVRKKGPEDATSAQEILRSMYESDGILLWPFPPEAYTRLAKVIEVRAVRAQYSDGWFETILEFCERVGVKAQKNQDEKNLAVTQLAMERLISEWLRHDDLWEETREGQFIFRLIGLSQEQWAQQLYLEKDPLNAKKITEELKIISENKIVKLPMASKLQLYAAKYIQGLVEFVAQSDDLLTKMKEEVDR